MITFVLFFKKGKINVKQQQEENSSDKNDNFGETLSRSAKTVIDGNPGDTPQIVIKGRRSINLISMSWIDALKKKYGVD
jgi:hypothetical protein